MRAPFSIFLLNKLHKLRDIGNWVEINIVEVLASRTIHEFVPLASEVVNDSLEKRWNVSFANAVHLEVINLLCKPLKLLRFH